MRDVPGLPYQLPDRGDSYKAKVEQRHFDLWLEEISQRPPQIMGVVDLAEENPWAPTIGDRVRTTTEWAITNFSPVLYGRIVRVAVTFHGTRIAEVMPTGASLIPREGVWFKRDDLQEDEDDG
jgi:hypothetical protein